VLENREEGLENREREGNTCGKLKNREKGGACTKRERRGAMK
jgi:hypothetical protein